MPTNSGSAAYDDLPCPECRGADGHSLDCETGRKAIQARCYGESAASHLAHPAVVDAYRKGYQDGVLETLSQLVCEHDLPEPVVEWARVVRLKVEADRG